MTRNREVLGVAAGAALLLALMLLFAASAAGAGLMTGAPGATLDLGPWIRLEIAGGAVASTLAGYVCRNVAGSRRAPLGLAAVALTFGALESVALLSASGSGRILVPAWGALAAPMVTALGVLLGGWLAGRGRPLAERRAHALPDEPRTHSRVALCIPPLVLASAIAVAAFGIPQSGAGVVATALTLDFTVVVPGLVYLLFVRTKRLPWVGVVPVFVGSYAIAFAMLPAEHRGLLDAMAVLAVPAEVGFVTYLIGRVRRAIRQPSRVHGDFASRFRVTAREAIGSRLPADILTTEVALLYHALRWPQRMVPDGAAFSVHRGVGYGTVMVGLFMVLAIETVPVHLFVSRWSPVAAWILTALSVYAGIWLLGDYRAMTARPLVVTATELKLRVGLRWEADIARGNIAAIDVVRPSDNGAPKGALDATLLDQPTVRIRLHEPVEVMGMYGIRRCTSEIWLTVDGAERLAAL
jgi:hypothetical protein